MRHLTEPLPSMISHEQLDSELRSEIELQKDTNPVEIYTDIQQHLSPGNLDIEYAHDKLEELSPEHPLWRLGALNSIYTSAKDDFSDEEKAELQAEIVDATYSLVARRLPLSEITGTGMPAAYFDEVNNFSSVTLNSVYRVGDAWDNTDRDEQVQDYLDKMIDHIEETTDNSKMRNGLRASFYKALYTGLSFHEASLQQLWEGDSASAYSKVGGKLIHIYMEKYGPHAFDLPKTRHET